MLGHPWSQLPGRFIIYPSWDRASQFEAAIVESGEDGLDW